MPERRFSVQIELKLYDFALPEGYDFFPIPDSLQIVVLSCLASFPLVYFQVTVLTHAQKKHAHTHTLKS